MGMKKVLVLMAMLAIAAAAHAEVLVGFDLAGATTDPLAANTTAANVTVDSGLNRVGLNAASSANAFGCNGWNLGAFAEGGDYISFSLSPASGYSLTLTDLSWQSVNGSNTGPRNGRWGYSIGGGAFTYQTDFNVTFANAGGAWAFDDVADVPSSVEFRFWAWGAPSINGGTSASTGSVPYRNGATAGNDIVLNGSVAPVSVPEPGVMALLSLGGLSVLRFARRRKA
jgi:hypothetical protein